MDSGGKLRRFFAALHLLRASLFGVTVGWSIVGRSGGDEMESEKGRKDGICLPFHTRMDHDGVGDGDDSHRDDAGNLSDFLPPSSGRQSVWRKCVIAVISDYITTATL